MLRRAGALGPHTTAVHATHLTDADVSALAAAGAAVSLCPTTERDLADGIGPAGALAAAGVRLVLGTDQHAMVDLLEEARAVELNERLATGRRGTFAPADLLHLLAGHDTLGWPDAGSIAVGQRADLVELDPRSIRTAGTDPAQILFAAGTPDVRTVVVDGQAVVDGGRHRLGDVGALLADAIAAVTTPAVTTGERATMTTTLITGIAELVTNDPAHGPPLGILTGAAVVVDDGRIAWVGAAASAPAADRALDLGGRAVIPGFVDSHTHLVFAGDRSAEFAARMAGERYDGGGIATTVAATRAASDDELRALPAPPGRRDARPGHHDRSRSSPATACPSTTRHDCCGWPAR